MTAPKPKDRHGRIGFWRMLRLLRKDILSAQSPRLFRARVARFSLPGITSYVVNDVPVLKSVLAGRTASSRRVRWIRLGLEPIMGQGIFLAEGDEWKKAKSILAPLERKFSIEMSGAAFAAARDRARCHLGNLNERTVELEAFSADVMLEIVFVQLFSDRPEKTERDALRESFKDYQRSSPLFSILNALPRSLRRVLSPVSARQRSANNIRRVLRSRLRRRQEAITGGIAVPDDGLQTLIESASAHGMPSRWIIDQLAVFVLAGHETGAAALAWALYLLAENKPDQDKVASEAQMVWTTEEVSGAKLRRLSFARDVFREALRLYPPLPMLARSLNGPVPIGDQVLSAGDQVVASIWHIHRHERYWQDPHDFRPARWRTHDYAPVRSHAFMPFSHGPRACPAASLALAEGSFLVSVVCQLVDLEPIKGDRPIPAATMTTRARDGIRVTVSPRKNSRNSGKRVSPPVESCFP